MNTEIIEKLSQINNSGSLKHKNIIVRRLLKEVNSLEYPILNMNFKEGSLNFNFDLFLLEIPFYSVVSQPVLIIKLFEHYPFKMPVINIDPNINYYYYLTELNILPEIHNDIVDFIGNSQIELKRYLIEYQNYDYEKIKVWNKFITDWSPRCKIDDILNKLYLLTSLG